MKCWTYFYTKLIIHLIKYKSQSFFEKLDFSELISEGDYLFSCQIKRNYKKNSLLYVIQFPLNYTVQIHKILFITLFTHFFLSRGTESFINMWEIIFHRSFCYSYFFFFLKLLFTHFILFLLYMVELITLSGSS